MSEKIRVLVVDDSPISRRFVVDLLNTTPDIQVIGEASNGVEAVRLTHSVKPQVVAMDLSLPLMDGLQATEMIMQEYPTRIVLFGEASQIRDQDLMTKITAAGALDLCLKPHKGSSEDEIAHFTKTLKAMASVRVIRTWSKKSEETAANFASYPGLRLQPEAVLIVCSTGGPQALETIFSKLPADFPLPIIVVQHIDGEFMGNMMSWLDGVTPLAFKKAEASERPVGGMIYLAPGGFHLRIAFDGRFALDPNPGGYLHVPSGDVLLSSAAEVYGANAIGVILTGMGSDGSHGLLKMREQGARTIVQDEATSIVFGMPKEAIALGAAEFVLPLPEIPDLLVNLARKRSHA